MKCKKATRTDRLLFISTLICVGLVFGFTIQASAGLNLEIPIEMVDYGLESVAGTGTTNFNRSWVYFDPADYHNATYYFEIVAVNTHPTSAYNVYLRSTSTSTTYATISVPANTTSPMRLPAIRSSAQWTPPTGKNAFLVRVSETPTAAQLRVYSARIIVQQTNADYTRIQIPMVHRHWSNTATGPGFVDPTTSTTYGQTNPNRYCLWEKDESKYGDLTGSTWTLEAVLDHDYSSGTAYAALFNTTSGQVSGAEVSNYGTTIALVEASFGNTATNFSNGDLFEVRIKSSTTTPQAELRRASLYVKLTSLTKAEVLYRVAGRQNSSAATDFVYQRALVDTSLFTSPAVSFQASGWCADNGDRVFLRDHGTNDTGTGGSNVVGSGINFNSGTKTLVRTSEISITDANRFYARTENSTNNVELTSAFVVVTFPTASCPTPGTPGSPSPADGALGQSIDVDLDWSDCTDTDTYDVYFGTSASPPLYASDVTISSYTLPTLEYCTKYYWKIIAKNAGGCSTTGDIWDFTTENGPPETPGSPDPADLETGVSANAILDWSDCTSTEIYDLYLGTSDPPGLYASDITDSTYDPNLDWDTHYYWKVVAKNSCGTYTESDTWEFTTGPQPAAGHFVDADNPNTPVSPYDSWDTAARKIQQAIGAASAGETVMVRAGTTYSTERVYMHDGKNLVAEAGVKPIISYNPMYDNGVVVFTGPMTCNLTGFDVRGTGMGSAIFVDGSGGQVNATIDNCSVTSSSMGVGIRLDGEVSTTITGCDIYQASGGPTVGIGNSGFSTLRDRLASNSSVTIKGNTIGGVGLGMVNTGIRLWGDTGASNIQVTIGGSGVGDGNTISHSGFVGIVTVDIDKVSIQNNDISNNGRAGIFLLDTSTVSPHIKNNSIHNNVAAAGINIGGASNVTIGDSNDIYNNETGISFYVANNGTINPVMDPFTLTKSSQPVTITGNNIYNNQSGGIAIRDGISGPVTITDNDIYSNTTAGIRMQRSCVLDINRNDIHDNLRGGIHTGSYLAEGVGFLSGHIGLGLLTIEKNKIYQNGSGGYGAGIDVRHMPGTIYNNLVYNNYKGGIRFGDYITEIINNTVVGNGNATGGGIAYDDLAGEVNDPAAGVPPAPLLIRNNISAYNVSAGIRACFTNTVDSEERDYNLVYSNNGTGETDCGWPDSINMRCANKNFGGCGGKWNLPGPPKILPDGPNNNIGDPLFESIVEGSEDYHLKAGSPAENAGDDNLDMGAYGGSDPFVDW